MGRFKKFLAVLLPAVVATGASGVVIDGNATDKSFQQAREAGTHEALTGFLLAHPDSAEAGLARDALIRGAGAPKAVGGDASFLMAAADCNPAVDSSCAVL